MSRYAIFECKRLIQPTCKIPLWLRHQNNIKFKENTEIIPIISLRFQWTTKLNSACRLISSLVQNFMLIEPLESKNIQANYNYLITDRTWNSVCIWKFTFRLFMLIWEEFNSIYYGILSSMNNLLALGISYILCKKVSSGRVILK